MAKKKTLFGKILKVGGKVVKTGLNVAEFVPGIGTAIKGAKLVGKGVQLGAKILGKGSKIASKVLGNDNFNNIVSKVKESGVLRKDKIAETIKKVTGKQPSAVELEQVQADVQESIQEDTGKMAVVVNNATQHKNVLQDLGVEVSASISSEEKTMDKVLEFLKKYWYYVAGGTAIVGTAIYFMFFRKTGRKRR